MQNWSTNTDKLEKNSAQYAIWKLEQLINFGIGKEKISESLLRIYWNKISIDPAKRHYLSSILWPKVF